MAESSKNINTIDTRSTITTDPMRSFRFRAKFTPVAGGSVFNKAITSFSGGFSSISGLSVATQPIPYREGGYNTTIHYVPGMTQFPPITLTRGALYGNDSAITWMRGLFAASAAEGFNVSDTSTNGFRCNVTIELMDHPNASGKTNVPRMGFFVQNAWISSLDYSPLDAGQGGIFVETITLTHEGLSIAMLEDDGTALAGSVKPAGF
jgi:phage tail-like protein